MGFNMRGDKNSLALLSSKRVKAYTRTRADEAFALPSFSDAMPIAATEPQLTPNVTVRQPEHQSEHDTENVKQTMLQHESLFKEQLHELHRLYEKQCVLMAESKQGDACHPRSEPPSSNSSLLVNDTVRPQEDIGVMRSFDINQIFCALPSQMDEVKPYEVNARCEYRRDCPMFDLERPAEDRPIFDLERPAEEYMDVEEVEEKPRAAGITCKLADVSTFVHSHVSGANRDRISWANKDPISGENRDFSLGEKKGLWGNKLCTSYDRDFASEQKKGLWGNKLCASYDVRKSDSVCEGTLGSKEQMYKGTSQHEDLACKGPEHNGMRLLQLAPSMMRNRSEQEAFSHSIQIVPDSGLFRGLPDLNGELNAAEQQTSPMEKRSEQNMKDRQYIDLEFDSRSSHETSKLPHWLCQGAPTAFTKPLPFKCSAQTSDWQQKTTLISPQMDDKSKQSSSLTWGHGEILKTTTTQESFYPWSQIGTSFQQGEISYREPPSAPSLRVFSGARTGAPEGSYKVADTGFVNESIPSFLSHVRDSEKVDMLNASGYLSSRLMDRQGPHFETELLSGVSSNEATALSTLLPWYQHGESFSSLMHHASNPELPNSYSVSSVNPWTTSTSHQVLPMERRILGMHTNSSNGEGPSHFGARPESFMKGPVYDFVHAKTELGPTLDLNMKGNETTTWRQVENPGQVAERICSSSNQCDHNARRNFFDLNVSIGQCCTEENFDTCQITESRCVAIEKEDLIQECEANRSSDWHVMSGIKAPSSYEQRSKLDLQATRVTSKVMASEVPTAEDTIQSQNGDVFFMEVDTLCSQGDRLGNDTCADYCSGEDETGGGFVEVKSSDGSGLTSCESRDAVHLELAKARDYSNTSSGEACQSRELKIPGHKEDVAFSSNALRKWRIGLPMEKVDCVVGSQEWESFLFPTMQRVPGFSQHDTKRDCSQLICSEFGDESEEAANSSARKHLIETAEAAELLLSLGFDLPSVAGEGYATNGPEKSLDWLADIIPQEENCEAQVLDAGMAFMAMHQGGCTELASEDATEKALDPFELAVLALKPINPEEVCLSIQAMDKSKESCPSLPNLRRRPSRKGRAGKDFQREMLRNMISLARHEITEDFQIIEGLIKSTTEAINRCSFSPEEKPLLSPELGSSKDLGKAKGTKACKGRKLNGNLNVCSWGESTRRKRMGRQRSQWSCLPPGVQTSLFVNNAGDGFF